MIHYTHANTPHGTMVIALKGTKIAGIAFGNESECREILTDLFGNQNFIRDDAKLAPYVQKITQGTSMLSDIHLEGTPFQQSVWQELLKIPKGNTVTYSDIATAIKKPKAVRAVGTAVGQNKISLLVPCHRVLPKAGGLGNYRWGTDVKEKLLEMERGMVA